MHAKFYKALIAILLLRSVFCWAQDSNSPPAQKPPLSKGQISADEINIRTDATINSEVICTVRKDQLLDIISESFEWYKVRIPPEAEAFVYKKFVSLDEDKTARINGSNVNVRIRADLASPILGRVNDGEPVKIIEESGDWFKIRAPESCYGWIHKNFVTKVKDETRPAKKQEEAAGGPVKKAVTVQGLLKPKIMTKVATHKLITGNNSIYLIRGDKEQLNSFNNSAVRIIGNLIEPASDTLPIIEPEQIEAVE